MGRDGGDVLRGGVVREIVRERHAGGFDLGQLALAVGVAAGVHQVEGAHVFQVEAIQDVGVVFSHAAEVAAQEDPLAAEQGDAGAAVLAGALACI